MGKVNFGLSNVYYAKITRDSSTGAITYGTKVALPGAVSLTLDVDGDQSIFWADNSKYAVFNAGGGFTGTLALADVPDSVLTDLLGYVQGNDGAQTPANTGLVDLANSTPSEFGLMFKVSSNTKATGFKYFCCTFGRLGQSANTTTDSTDPDTVELSVTVSSVDNGDGVSVLRQKATLGTGTGEIAESTFFSAIALPHIGS